MTYINIHRIYTITHCVDICLQLWSYDINWNDIKSVDIVDIVYLLSFTDILELLRFGPFCIETKSSLIRMATLHFDTLFHTQVSLY